MTNEEMAMQLAKGMNAINQNSVKNVFSPGPVIIFPGYEDWKASRCKLEGSDDSLDTYWKERREAMRYYNMEHGR